MSKPSFIETEPHNPIQVLAAGNDDGGVVVTIDQGSVWLAVGATIDGETHGANLELPSVAVARDIARALVAAANSIEPN